MPDPEYHYQAFISYSHADQQWASWLHRALESYRVPKRLRGTETRTGKIPARIAPVFRDTEELASATNLSDEINRALEDSRTLIVLCSPNSARSHWVNEEVLQFKKLGRANHIFCLITSGEPIAPEGSEEDCFVKAIRYEIDPQGRLTKTPTEPIAADVRPGVQTKDNAKLKLIAGILGVGFDELKQRELQKRHQRMAWITAASLAAVVFASTLAGFALIQRNEADRQRVVAENQAETARRTSEFLVELFNVADPSEARGRAITAHEILEKGRKRIQSSLKGEDVIRGRLLQTMGRVYTGLGLYDTAGELLRDALNAQNKSRLFDESVTTQVALGDALYLQGQYQESMNAYLAVTKPLNIETLLWTKDYSNAFRGLANTYIEFDQLNEAESLLRKAQALDISTWGDNNELTGDTTTRLGSALFYAAKFEQAEQQLQKSLAIYKQVLPPAHPKIADSTANMGSLYYFWGNAHKAMEYWLQSIDLYRLIFGNSHPELASLLNNLGRVELEFGELKQAQLHLAESVSIDRKLGREGHDDLVFAINSLALAETGLGNHRLAKSLYDEAIALARKTDHRMLGPLLINRADLLCSSAFNQQAKASQDLTNLKPLMLKHYDPTSWRFFQLQHITSYCQIGLSQHENIETSLTESYDKLLAHWQKGYFVASAAKRMTEYYRLQGDSEEAAKYNTPKPRP